MEGVRLTKARRTVNNDASSRNKAKHCKHLWIGPGNCFVEGVEVTKSRVDHPSIMIRPQKARPSAADVCGLERGNVLWRLRGSPRQV